MAHQLLKSVACTARSPVRAIAVALWLASGLSSAFAATSETAKTATAARKKAPPAASRAVKHKPVAAVRRPAPSSERSTKASAPAKPRVKRKPPRKSTARVAAPGEVSFKSLDGTPITARVRMPAAGGGAPTGAVIVLHDCGGLRLAGPSGELGPRNRAMAEMLNAEGYVAVFPDSLSARGERDVCGQRDNDRERGVGPRERRADALAALSWVAAQRWADPRRVALLGWGQGGTAVLAATDAKRPDVQASTTLPAVAVAFHPACADAVRTGYWPSAPLVILLGGRDERAPVAPCAELARTVSAELNVYADAAPDFDGPPPAPPSFRASRAVAGTAGVTVGSSSTSTASTSAAPTRSGPREQAHARLKQVLKTAFR